MVPYKNLIHSLKIADSTSRDGGHGPNDTRHTRSSHRPSRNKGKGMGTGYIRVLSGMRMKWSMSATDSDPILAIRPKKCKRPNRQCQFSHSH